MGSIYLTWLADELRAAGLRVVEYQGWQTRARSSGGYSAQPLAVAWHHTASNSSAKSDCDYMCLNSDSKPVANIYVAGDGEVWVLAAGATNTNGKGKSMSFSRGTVSADNANSQVVGIEGGNNGVGEAWTQAQIDAFFLTSNVINRRLGNQPTDMFSHQFYAPDRKIDPATAAAVQGPWDPRSLNSSGTWNLDDIRAECARRGTNPPDGGFDLSQQQYDDIMNKLDYISRQCDQIAVNIYGNPDGQNPPYAASVWGRIDTVSRQTADVQNGVTAALATLWGNTPNPPYNLSVNGMLVQILTLMGANPWDPPPAAMMAEPVPTAELTEATAETPPQEDSDAGRR